MWTPDTYIVTSDVRVILYFTEQRTCKVIDFENTGFPFAPICCVSKAVDAYMLEVRISGQPFLGPIVVEIGGFRPSFS